MKNKHVQNNNPAKRSAEGFTLVELLVVIAIIGILVGLLMSAVMTAQNEARRTQCEQNLRNVSLALLSFESSKQYFPGWKNKFRNVEYGWQAMILEQLGSGDLNKKVLDGTIKNSETPHLAILNCPSDTRVKGRQSYRINGGIGDSSSKKCRSTGLSFDLTQNIKNDLKVNSSMIADGAGNTILVGENSNERADWVTDYTLFRNCLLYDKSTAWGTNQFAINREMDNNTNSIKDARPSSRHRGVALVAFADQHVQGLKDSIAYNTYKAIMCPNDSTANTDFSLAIETINDNNYP